MVVKWDLLGFGCVAVDDLLYVDYFPAPDTKMPVADRHREGGGLTGTALVAASRLGATTAFAGVLGEDELSRFTVESLEQEGVDCGPVLRQDGARPYHAVIIVDQSSGQRTILYTGEGVVQRQPEHLPEDLVLSCRVLFVDSLMGEGGVQAVRLAQKYRIPVLADLEDETGPGVMELADLADHLIVGIEFGGRVTGEADPARMVQAFAHPGRTCCAVTAGQSGCWYSEQGGPVRRFPAFRVEVVDTTGCGDVFHGAYAACIAGGERVEDAIRVASATAGIKATQPGGRTGIPDRAAVDSFLRGYHQHQA